MGSICSTYEGNNKSTGNFGKRISWEAIFDRAVTQERVQWEAHTISVISKVFFLGTGYLLTVQ